MTNVYQDNLRTWHRFLADFPGYMVLPFETDDIGPGLMVINEEGKVIAYGNDIDDSDGTYYLDAKTPAYNNEPTLEDIQEGFEAMKPALERGIAEAFLMKGIERLTYHIEDASYPEFDEGRIIDLVQEAHITITFPGDPGYDEEG